MAIALRLATFNIQHGRTPGGDVDVDLLGRCCASLEADVLALQEVDDGLRRSDDTDTAAAVAAATGMAHVFGVAIEVGGGRYGNALLVRGTIRDVEIVPLADAEPRSGIVARVEVDGAPGLSVVATHLGLRGAGEAQLPILLDVLGRRPGPRVLLGDLNLEPPPVERLAAEAGFSRVAAGPTWPARRPRREIDHVLLDGPSLVAAEVRHLPVSDHRALLVTVDVPVPDHGGGASSDP